jgi:hypothetical protein
MMGGTSSRPADAGGGEEAHPDHPDLSRPVGNAAKGAGDGGIPDHPDRSRPDCTIPRPATSPLRSLVASWQHRWAAEAEAGQGNTAATLAAEAEAEAMAAHYAAPAAPAPYRPGDPDPLRDGLLRGWRRHRPRSHDLP